MPQIGACSTWNIAGFHPSWIVPLGTGNYQNGSYDWISHFLLFNDV
jgi:hypothetical protein